MAIDKLNYVKPGKHAKAIALKTLKYIGKDKEETPRILFGHDGELTREQAEEMIKNAPKNTYFWRLILSPDRKTENIEKKLNLRKLTKEFIEFLEVRLNYPDIPFIAAEHKNTDNPHTHTLFFLQRRGRELMITPELLKELFIKATEMALSLKEERALLVENGRVHKSQVPLRKADHAHGTGGRRGIVYAAPVCPQCGFTPPSGSNANKLSRCPNCGYDFSRSRSVGLGAEGGF